MPRAATCCRTAAFGKSRPLRACGTALALLALCCTARGAQTEVGTPKPDLTLQVVILAATGRAEKPQFDPRTPRDLRKQIEDQNLAYGRYDVVGIHRNDARFAADATFSLPDKESLAIRPLADAERPALLRIACRLLDADRKPILVNTMRVSFGRAFIIQRAKGPGRSLLLGISAHRPGEPPPK